MKPSDPLEVASTSTVCADPLSMAFFIEVCRNFLLVCGYRIRRVNDFPHDGTL